VPRSTTNCFVIDGHMHVIGAMLIEFSYDSLTLSNRDVGRQEM